MPNSGLEPRKANLFEQGYLLTQRLPGKWARRARESAQWALNYNGARGTGRRAFRFARQGRHNPLLVARFGDGLMIVDPQDEEIGRVVYIRGEYERQYLTATIAFLRDQAGLVPGERTMVDIGANIGTTTVDALRHFGFQNCLSIEPDSRNLSLLRMNILLNDLWERATIVHAAASDDDETTVTLVRDKSNFGDSRITSDTPAGDGETVATVRIDTVLAEHDIEPGQVGLLWIDVQGHEAHVLRGASALIRDGVPIVVEYGMADGRDLDDLEAMAREHYTHVLNVRTLATNPDSSAATLDSADLPQLRDRYGPGRYTDLLLVRLSGVSPPV